tara:strand:- start:183135 stop:183917 length:783 start_codon:yes stop_codon:yes gene_type:complete
MTKLFTMLDSFQDYLISGNEDKILPSIVEDHISAPNHLKIYYNAYRLRLLDILQMDFPKTLTLMGDEHFEVAFHQYLKQYPSTHFSVRYFGQNFMVFLQNTAPYDKHTAIAEMAQFEWSLMDTLDAADAPTASLESLSQLAPEQWANLMLTFQPSLKVIVCEWNTPALWKMIDAEDEPTPPAKNSKPVAWVLWRHELRSLFQSLTPDQTLLFDCFQTGLNFSEVMEHLSSHMAEDEIPTFALQNMQLWIQSGMVSECKVL